MRRRRAEPKPGLLARARAIAEWERGISETNGKETIDSYIRTAAGLNWTWESAYEHNGQFAWCGAFAAAAWVAVKLELRREHFASTYRLKRWARNTPRMVEPRALEPGDIAIVGAAAGAKWGDHVVIVDAVEAEQIRTIEGNATGLGPNGETWEGVVRSSRLFVAPSTRVMRVLFGVRPLPEDF